MSEFTEEVLWELNELDDEGANYQDVIRVVKYGKGGPLLEKRNFYYKDNEWRMGKARGFTMEEFYHLIENQSTIEKVLKEKKDSKKTSKKKTPKKKTPKKKTSKKSTKKKKVKK